jgi:hypothetical protein
MSDVALWCPECGGEFRSQYWPDECAECGGILLLSASFRDSDGNATAPNQIGITNKFQSLQRSTFIDHPSEHQTYHAGLPQQTMSRPAHALYDVIMTTAVFADVGATVRLIAAHHVAWGVGCLVLACAVTLTMGYLLRSILGHQQYAFGLRHRRTDHRFGS